MGRRGGEPFVESSVFSFYSMLIFTGEIGEMVSLLALLALAIVTALPVGILFYCVLRNG